MKKNIMMLLAVALFTACTEEQPDILQPGTDSDVTGITITAEDFTMDAQTRTVLTPTADGMQFSWANNDTVGIYPNRGDQVCFPISTGTESNTATFDGGGWSLKSSAKYAAYYPFNKANYFRPNSSVLLKYAGQKQTQNASAAHLSSHDFMAASASVPQDGNVTFAFKHLNSMLQLNLTMPKAATFTSLTLSTSENDLTEEATLNLQAEPASLTTTRYVNSLILDLENITTTADNQEITLYMMIAPTNLSGKQLSANLLDVNGNSYSVSLEAKNFEAGKAYSFTKATVLSDATTDVTLSSAGTLLAAVGGYDNLLNIRKLKITGEINGDDVYEIRKMANLEYLNLKDSKIVAGGKAYYSIYTTAENEIGNSMFYRCENIKQIILPNNIKVVGAESFWNCKKLMSISIPEGVTSIGDHAFALCWALSSVSFPNSLEYLDSSAFRFCNSLKNITIPENVTTIGRIAFEDCEKLESVHIKALPSTLTTIESDAFKGCYENTSLYVPKGTKTAYQATELGRFRTIIEE